MWRIIMMSQAEALSIVIDLAKQNIISMDDNFEEHKSQCNALDKVEEIWAKICNGASIVEEE